MIGRDVIGRGNRACGERSPWGLGRSWAGAPLSVRENARKFMLVRGPWFRAGASRGKMVVDPGLVVDPVHDDPPE
jgi:hypothetical protein